MSETILMGQGDQIIEIPRKDWEQGVSAVSKQMQAGLTFMSADHRRVCNFAVRELPNVGKPLSPEFIADKLNLPVECVNIILEDLEKHLTFLFRNEQGAAAWAYPVTTDTTPHHVTFSTGEQVVCGLSNRRDSDALRARAIKRKTPIGCC
jgi:hypothetical protein